MWLVDTCGWIEWLTNGELSDKYEPYFNEAIALTEQAKVTLLSTSIALSAADFSADHKLSFADAIIFATAQFHKAELITSDEHFKGLPEVNYFVQN